MADFDLQVRNAQLDKEAAELRRESVELSHAAQEARNGVANSQEASWTSVSDIAQSHLSPPDIKVRKLLRASGG